MKPIRLNPSVPFDPARLPFFYGWAIILIGIIGMMVSLPGQTMGFSVFTEALLSDLVLNREQLSLSYGIGTILSSFLLTSAGKLYDKHGARIIAIIGGLGLALTLVFLTLIPDITAFLSSVWANVAPIIWTLPLITIGFFGIRFFGQGIITMVSRNMVMKWFDWHRGLANGFLGMAVSVGFSSSPILLNHLIGLYDWRNTWLILAVVAGIFFVIFAWLFFRDNPQESGLIPDGKVHQPKSDQPVTHPKRDFTLSEVKKMRVFWVFNFSVTMFALYFTALTFHIESIFKVAGMDEDKAFSIFLPGSIIALVLHLAGSTWSDYTKLKYFLYLLIVGYLVSMTGIVLLGDYSFAYYLVIIGHGLVNGMFGILSAVTWPRFFGNKHLGAITGFNMTWVVAGSAVGPFFFALLKNIQGNYDIPVMILAVLCVVLFFFSFNADNPNEKAEVRR